LCDRACAGEAIEAWVVFDLDGTLIESEQIWADVRRRFVIDRGGHWNEGSAAAMIGMRTHEWARYIHNELGVGLAPGEIAQRVVERVVARLSECVPVLPGADAALKRLAKAFTLGLATSATLAVAKTALAKTGWERYFQVVVSADEVARGKPAPDVYLRALELLHAATARTAAVEDSANGIRSAYAARLVVIAIPNRAYPPDNAALSLATQVMNSLDDLSAAAVDRVLRERGG
jgi:HAD superfamily hydrolase (TIGR01509 family)